MKLLIILLLISANAFGQVKGFGNTIQDGQTSFFHDTQADSIKTDTVKGWVMYYRRVFQYIGFSSTPIVLYYGDSATAIYHKPEADMYWGIIHQYNPKHGYIMQILIRGKDFDLNKRYEFIDDDEVVKNNY